MRRIGSALAAPGRVAVKRRRTVKCQPPSQERNCEYLADGYPGAVVPQYADRDVLGRCDECPESVLLAALLAPACSGSPTEPTKTHGPEGTGGEAGESGTRYGPGDEARELRGGVELVMRFEQGAERFSGTVRNTTNQTARDVRVEIHLSNGVELGPTPRVDLGAGETRPVELDARGQAFDWWTVHVELGSGAS